MTASTSTSTPYRSGQQAGRDGFAQQLRAEWTKFRTVRGWVIGMIAAALLTGLATVALAGSANARVNPAAHPQVAVGPGGRAVTDAFYFVRQPLAGLGSITVRVTSLTGIDLQPDPGSSPAAQPWAKAGIIITESTRPGSPYAAMMITKGHGVRMQYDYTHDTAGLPGEVSAASPRWLRLTRSGSTVTGYDSADGTHWARVGAVSLAGPPATVQAGMFAASPPAEQSRQTFANNNGIIITTRATAVFDHVSLHGAAPGSAWSGGQVGTQPSQHVQCRGPGCRYAGGQAGPGDFRQSGGTFTVAGSGDIAPYVPVVDPLGISLKGSLVGLLAVIALGALFVTTEYRRGLIRTTFTASPRRGRVLAAKAIVTGLVTFVAGLAGAAVAFPIVVRKLSSAGWATSVYPVWSLTSGPGLRMVVGTAGLLAVAAILALAAGTILRRSAGAIAAVIGLLILPLVLGTILPMTAAQWLLRYSPAAAFSLQQGIQRYPQVSSSCLPYNGCYPLAPWAGFGVLCAWAGAALIVAVLVLRRRDA